MKNTLFSCVGMNRRYLGSAIILSTVLLAGCTTTTSPTTTAPTTTTPAAAPVAAGTPINLAFITNSTSSFFTLAVKGIHQAEKDTPNVNVQVVMPADGTAATQKSDTDDVMAKGIQGLALDPIDPVNQVAYINSLAAKIPLITFDSDAPASTRLTYIGSDNVQAGELAGQELVKALPQGGTVMLFVGKRDAQNAKDREKGVREGIAGSKVTIIDVRTDDTDHARAKENAADCLTKYPNIAGLVGLWNYNGPAILSAVQDAGKVGKVKIVCFDDDPATLTGVKSGAIFGTVVQQPYQFGYQSVKLLVQLINGDKSGLPANKQIIIPVQFITPATIDAYQAQINKEMAVN